MNQLDDLLECTNLFEDVAPGRVDREKGLIRGVSILNWGQSLNGNTYAPDGIDPAMYQNRVVNVNHIEEGKRGSAYDRFGRIVNVRKDAAGLRGDLEVLKSHPLAGAVFEAAERFPNLFGLSHRVARGDYTGRPNPGRGVKVESIRKVSSVDLTGDPSSVNGLFESKGGKVATTTLKALAESLKPTRPRYAKALLEFAEAGILSPDASMPAEPAGDAGGGADHEQAILDACKACIDDTNLGIADKIKKIRKLLKLTSGGEADGAAGGPFGDAAGGEDEEEDEEMPTESVNELARLRAEKRLRKAAADAGVTVSDTILESVRADLTDAQIKALAADWKAQQQAQRHGGHARGARSATPIAQPGKKDIEEGKDADDADFTDERRKARVASLRQDR